MAIEIHHQVTFDFPIKSIIPGHDPGLLLVETANMELKEQTFLLLSLDQLEILQAISFGSDYSGLMVKSYDLQQLLVIQYSNQNNPDQTNLYTFSWTGGDPTYSLQNTRIIKSGRHWVQVPHPHFANKNIIIDLKSGKELSTKPDPSSENIPNELKYTRTYPDSSEYFAWFEQYFRKQGIVPYKQIEYLKLDRHILISFYQKQENGLSHHLAILNTGGEMLECFLLDQHLQGIGRDNFIVLRNKAIFVTDKRNLNFYDL